ncbi:hypothetical protein LCGC14_2074720 [marine sediment metagenome]|uniref:Peptide deformylase n=1 Tax=marine sediment metagenome TaxID=412755 RepID=A0A0F9EH82_9ZZZZ
MSDLPLIVTDPEVLRLPTVKVNPERDLATLDELVGNLFQVMAQRQGLGLSANQIGSKLRVCVLAMAPDSPICLVNPVLHKVKGSQTAEEGCLSLPGVIMRTRRPAEVVVVALNQYLHLVKYRLRNLRAVTLCHELDHLDGKLIIDQEAAEKVWQVARRRR